MQDTSNKGSYYSYSEWGIGAVSTTATPAEGLQKVGGFCTRTGDPDKDAWESSEERGARIVRGESLRKELSCEKPQGSVKDTPKSSTECSSLTDTVAANYPKPEKESSGSVREPGLVV